MDLNNVKIGLDMACYGALLYGSPVSLLYVGVTWYSFKVQKSKRLEIAISSLRSQTILTLLCAVISAFIFCLIAISMGNIALLALLAAGASTSLAVTSLVMYKLLMPSKPKTKRKRFFRRLAIASAVYFVGGFWILGIYNSVFNAKTAGLLELPTEKMCFSNPPSPTPAGCRKNYYSASCLLPEFQKNIRCSYLSLAEENAHRMCGNKYPCIYQQKLSALYSANANCRQKIPGACREKLKLLIAEGAQYSEEEQMQFLCFGGDAELCYRRSLTANKYPRPGTSHQEIALSCKWGITMACDEIKCEQVAVFLLWPIAAIKNQRTRWMASWPRLCAPKGSS